MKTPNRFVRRPLLACVAGLFTAGAVWQGTLLVSSAWAAEAKPDAKVWQRHRDDATKALQQGKLAEAEKFLLAAVKEGEKFGPKDRAGRLWESLHDLAIVYGRTGRALEAEPLLQWATELAEETYGKNHLKVGISLLSLGEVQFALDKLKEADQTYLRAQKTMEMALGRYHAVVGRCVFGRGKILLLSGKDSEADALFKQALDLAANPGSRIVFAQTHDPAVSALSAYRVKGASDDFGAVQMLETMGALYLKQEKLAQANDSFKQMLNHAERQFGKKSPDYADAWSRVASAYLAQSRYAEAEPYWKQAVELEQKISGVSSMDVATDLNKLADICKRQEKFVEAEQHARSALALAEKALGPEHRQLMPFLSMLQFVCSQQGKTAESESVKARMAALASQKSK